MFEQTTYNGNLHHWIQLKTFSVRRDVLGSGEKRKWQLQIKTNEKLKHFLCFKLFYLFLNTILLFINLILKHLHSKNITKLVVIVDPRYPYEEWQGLRSIQDSETNMDITNCLVKTKLHGFNTKVRSVLSWNGNLVYHQILNRVLVVICQRWLKCIIQIKWQDMVTNKELSRRARLEPVDIQIEHRSSAGCSTP